MKYEVVLTVGSHTFLSHRTYDFDQIERLVPTLRGRLPSMEIDAITTEEGDKKYRSDLPEVRRQCD